MCKKFFLSAIALAASSVSLMADGAENLSTLSQDHTAFALALYPALDTKEGNLVFSPYSIATCLSMVYVGARGETESQIQKTLHLSVDRKAIGKASSALAQSLMPAKAGAQNYSLNIANALWADQSVFLLADFRYAVEEQFKAKLGILNFAQSAAATTAINTWISQETQGKIPSLLNENDLNLQTRLVLTNAVYFKGSWVRPFNPEATADGPFHPNPDATTTVKMMQQTASLPYYENDLLQIAALPFNGATASGSSLALVVLLPKSADNFSAVFQQLSPSLKEWLSSLKTAPVALTLPKFTLLNRYDLNQPLEQLGMEDAFDSDANLTGIDGMRDLFLNKVIHETFFALDEAGVTAAAATAAAMGITSVPATEPPAQLIADHPFLFFIVDLMSQEMLFMGKMAQPGP